MKKIFIAAIIFLLPLATTAQKVKPIDISTAAQFNNLIIDMVDSMDALWKLSIKEKDLEKSLKWTASLKKMSINVISTLDPLEGFDWDDTQFKNAALTYAKHFKKISSKDLPAYLKIVRKKGTMSVIDEAKAETYLPELFYKREYLSEEVEKAQYTFADLTGLEIERRGNEFFIRDYEEHSNITKATDYHDYIVDMVDIIDLYWALTIEAEIKEVALAYNDTLIMRTEKVLGSLKKLGPFQEYDDMRTKANDYAVHMNNIAKNELKEFILIIRSDEMTTDGEKRAQSLLPVLDDQREALYVKITEEQQVMAQKFDFIIMK